jgi:transcriptional regulator with XRE-family HTH domain
MNPDFNKRLRAFRKHERLNQEEFAEKIGKIQQNITAWEKENGAIPETESLEAIFKAFPNLNPNWLKYGEKGGEMLIKKTTRDDSGSDKTTKEEWKDKVIILQQKVIELQEKIDRLRGGEKL